MGRSRCAAGGAEIGADICTPRERDVLLALTRGLSNKEIARALGLSTTTVKYHLSNIYRKVGVSTRLALFAWSLENVWDGGSHEPASPQGTDETLTAALMPPRRPHNQS